jgi:hypothetical protein
MKLKTFFTLKAAITTLFAISFIFLPEFTWRLFGLSLPPEGVVFANYIGVSFVAIALVCWLNRDAVPEAQRNATLTLAITDTIGFVVSLFAQLRGIPNAWGWFAILLWLSLAAGNIYYRWFSGIVFDSAEAV